MLDISDLKIAIIGLGYVGLPLLAAFSGKVSVCGFDINKRRVHELQQGIDKTNELNERELVALSNVTLISDKADLKDCNCFIVTVPTPIDEFKVPDLRPLLSACEIVGSVLKEQDIVIFESTVYPGATENECATSLNAVSHLEVAYEDGSPSSGKYYLGYSPERINPGDSEHRISDIVKVTAGSTPAVAALINSLYGKIISAGTHLAPNIKTAEAAKVIENIQRDVNIALINELAVLFHQLDLDTEAVLDAASTKWNFLNFRPGLVGGHCIGVDPYYLTHRAIQIGYHPELILAGRRINDMMVEHVAGRVVRLMLRQQIQVAGARVLMLGVTFKENCPDLRNSQAVRLIDSLEDYGCEVTVFDPWVDLEDAPKELHKKITSSPKKRAFDSIVLTVAHLQFKRMSPAKIREFGRSNHVLFDVKHVLSRLDSDGRL